MKKILLTSVFILLYTAVTYSQSVYFNTSSDSIYALTGSPGSCTYQNIGIIGQPGVRNYIFSIAAHKDTIYYLTGNTLTGPPSIYYFKISNPSNCKLVTTLPPDGYNSFTIDKNGILYFINTYAVLYSYDTYNKIGPTRLGSLPQYPAGDLIFYKNKLLYAAIPSGIFEVNLGNTIASTQYMTTPGYNFIGLMSFPYDCNNNKFYGINGSSLIELDIDAKKIIGQACTIPFVVYDAASTVEDGTTNGVSIDSIAIKHRCDSKFDTTSLTIQSYSATLGQLTFTLDNNLTNVTGNFSGVAYGLHHIHVVNQSGCIKDSDFNVPRPSATVLNFSNQNPASCVNQNGVISVGIQSGNPPYLFSINNGNFQSIGQFTNLSDGQYTISVKDGYQCKTDSIIQLKYIQQSNLFSTVTTLPTYCNAKSGKISITLSSGTNASSVKTSLNNGPQQSALQFTGLDSGTYLISIFNVSGCRQDTTVFVTQIINIEPSISISTTDQLCVANNGKLDVSVSGTSLPYSISLNNSAFSQQTLFNNLAPGIYSLKIRDKDLCEWDTSATVKKYTSAPFTWKAVTTKAKCTQPTSGTLAVAISGTEPPYSFKLDNIIYQNGYQVGNLLYGNYVISFFNKDGCLLDTASVYIDVDMSPECAQVWLPNAFTPNGDGKNDVFKPIVSTNFKNVVFYIYNRYGQLLFSDAKGNGWDGTLNGVAQPAGIYVCMVKYTTATGEATSKQGTFLLMR